MTLALTAGLSGVAPAKKKAASITATPSITNTVAPLASPPPLATQPNYTSLLANDPQLGAQNAAINAQGVTNQAQLSAARQRALINYGAIPSLDSTLAGDLSGSIDDTTRSLADAATAGGVSTVAQLRKAYDQKTQGDTANLAARGLLRSGAYGQHQNEDLSNYNIAGYNAQQSLADYLNGLWAGYQSQQQNLQQQGVQNTNDALTRIIQQIQNGTLAADAPPAPSLTAPEVPTYNPPDAGPYSGYVPDGTPNSDGTITASDETYFGDTGAPLVSPGGGVYRSGGGNVTYQSNKGKYGGKLLL